MKQYSFDERMEVNLFIEIGSVEAIQMASNMGVDFNREDGYSLMYAASKGRYETFVELEKIVDIEQEALNISLKHAVSSGSDELSNHLLDKYTFSEQAYKDAYNVAITDNSVSLMNKLSAKIEDTKVFEEGFVVKSKSSRTKFRNDDFNGYYFEHLVDLTNNGKFNARISLITECLKEATKYQSADFVSEMIETFSINDFTENSQLSDKKRVAIKDAFEISLLHNGTSGKRSNVTDELTSVMSKDEKLNRIMQELSINHVQKINPTITKQEILDKIRDDLMIREGISEMLKIELSKKDKVQVKEDAKFVFDEQKTSRSNSAKF